MVARLRTRLDVDARRAQLLGVGMDVFSERAYDDVQMHQVSERAGVSRALLYHYFPSKREFFIAVVQHAMAEGYQASETDPDLPPLARTRAGVEGWLRHTEEHARAALTASRAEISADPGVRAIVQEGRERQVARLVEQIAGRRDVPPVLEVAVRGWLRLVSAVALDWIERPTIERDRLLDLLAGALGAMLVAARQADPGLDDLLPPPPEA